MKAAQIRKKTKKELETMLYETREKLRGLRFDLGSSRVKNVREINSLKKDIARILSILKEK